MTNWNQNQEYNNNLKNNTQIKSRQATSTQITTTREGTRQTKAHIEMRMRNRAESAKPKKQKKNTSKWKSDENGARICKVTKDGLLLHAFALKLALVKSVHHIMCGTQQCGRFNRFKFIRMNGWPRVSSVKKANDNHFENRKDWLTRRRYSNHKGDVPTPLPQPYHEQNND